MEMESTRLQGVRTQVVNLRTASNKLIDRGYGRPQRKAGEMTVEQMLVQGLVDDCMVIVSNYIKTVPLKERRRMRLSAKNKVAKLSFREMMRNL